MFSSSKILFSKSSVATPPLSVAVQPQNVTLGAGSTTKIGQTTWAVEPGYNRSMVRWQRSLNGINWSLEDAYDTYEQDGGFRLLGGADPAQSGLKYRAYAWAYEQYTSLSNYMSPGGSPYESMSLGATIGFNTVNISGSGLQADTSILFVKGESFTLTFSFEGPTRNAGNSQNYASVSASIENTSLGSITNGVPFMQENTRTVKFSARPGELMRFDWQIVGTPSVLPEYGFVITTETYIPLVGTAVFTEPFTLTVTP